MRWTTPLGLAFLAAAAAGSLQGCAHAPAPAPSPAPTPAACVGVKAYTPDQLRAMSAAVRALAPDSPLRGLVVDYQRLRDTVRASCGAASPP